jgi:hypothetical protein
MRHHASVTPTLYVSVHGERGIPRSPADSTQHYATFLLKPSTNLVNNTRDTWHCLRYYRWRRKGTQTVRWTRKSAVLTWRCLVRKNDTVRTGTAVRFYEQPNFRRYHDYGGVMRGRSWLRHCATNRKVAGSIPDGVTGIFHWHPPGRTMALGSTQPITYISTRNIFLVVKAAGAQAYNLITFMCWLS